MPYRPAVAFMKNYTARHDWLPGVPLEEIGNLQVWPGGREGRRGDRAPPPPEPEGCRVGAVAGLLARGNLSSSETVWRRGGLYCIRATKTHHVNRYGTPGSSSATSSMKQQRPWWWFLATAASCCWASIDIKTLPPDLSRWLGSGRETTAEGSSPRISPDWAGDHSAVLDGDQGRVILSWTISGDTVEFKVRFACSQKIVKSFIVLVYN